MNIFKRPMFFAAAICSVAATLSLYLKIVTIVFLLLAIVVLSIQIIKKNYRFVMVLLAVLAFTASLSFEFIDIKKIEQNDNQVVSGKFLVIEEIEKYDDYNTVTLKALDCDKLPQNTKCFVFDYKKTKFKMGDIVSADIKITAINDYDEYRLYDYGNGVYATASAKKITKLKEKNLFYKTAGEIRSYVKNAISTRFDKNTAGLILALTTGDKSIISDSFTSNIKTTGISHVIVVSGMHLSIIMSAVFWILDRLFYNKYVRSFLSIAFVIAVLAICGFTMSITRAASMFIIAGLSSVFSRDNDSLSSLFTAITAVLIFAPFSIVNISFLLSVLSTLAIIWAVPFYNRLIVERFKIASKILKTTIIVFLCSIFAIVFTLPVTIKTFGFVSIVSPLTNMLIAYPITVALVVNILALMVAAIPVVEYLSYPLFWITELCAKFIVFVVNAIAKLPITVAVLPKSAFWWSIWLIAVVIGYMYYYEYKKKRSDLNANNI